MTNLLSIIAQEDNGGGGSIFSFLLLPLMLVGMYFLIIRPNSKRRKEAAALQSELAVGDEVITTAGIVGTITGEDGPSRFWLEIDDDVQVRIARGHIQGKLAPESDSASDSDSDSDDVAETGSDDADVTKKSADGD